MITVCNLHYGLPDRFEYIGPRNNRLKLEGSPLANPYPIDIHISRDVSMQLFEAWLLTELRNPESAARLELERLRTLAQLTDLTLGCWCAPEPCSGDIIANYLTQGIPPAGNTVKDHLFVPAFGAYRAHDAIGESSASQVAEQLWKIAAPEVDPFHIGQLYDRKVAEGIICTQCGNSVFQVAVGSYFTAIRCTTCLWEICVHNG